LLAQTPAQARKEKAMKASSFEECLWVTAIDLFTLQFKDKNGDLISVDMPMAVAGQLVASVDAALKQIQNEGRIVPTPAPPERILRFDARRSKTETGEVVLALVLDRSNPLVGRLKTLDAKSLAALLTSAAENHESGPTKQ
jgi:hypothetical protein